MDRFVISLPTVLLVALVGCGSQVESPAHRQTASSTPTPPAAVENQVDQPSPSDVVSQFLDEVRRGGEDSRANDLLTEKARTELRRIGQQIQPIGSPDARFQVTRAENVPGEENSALVHSIWSEPGPNGSSSDFQVVWAVERESAGWRISGLAMELEPNSSPIIMDFENAEMMSALLSAPNQESAVNSGDTAPDSQSARLQSAINR